MTPFFATLEQKIFLNMESIAIFSGAMTGALWKVQFQQVLNDLLCLQNIEQLIVVACRAFVGAAVAWGFKRTCNYFTRKKITKKNHV